MGSVARFAKIALTSQANCGESRAILANRATLAASLQLKTDSDEKAERWLKRGSQCQKDDT
ncbi:MAG: hypothetical protein U0Z53_07725 [Blastocatellia bacterium]